jgi:RhtB (resistance to homoserine/threonine) family protein
MGIDFAPFLLISVLLILIPGPDTAIVTKHALLAGRRGGVFASVGVATGLAIWTLAAAVGVAAVLRASEVAFLALKIAGAIYLVWMGIQLLRDRSTLAPGVGGNGTPRRGAAKKALRQGLLSDLSNPKIAVFFTSFLPQFVHGDSHGFASLLVLGSIFCVLTLLWLLFYGMLVGHGSTVLRRPAVRRALDRFTGVVLVAFGIRLAFEHR